ncbi:hypothetical protein ASZ90_015062 [hydrocarbon metagenome]|uniref:Uncharacterized protein n=1 Tax=hydrocarbon metagenome TaxID=938273 RepID=A0A0W8F4F8_9ZZZZ
MEAEETRAILADLIWLNAVIATELIQITENVSALLREAPPPESCIRDHNRLRAEALRIAEKYHKEPSLREHLMGHQ